MAYNHGRDLIRAHTNQFSDAFVEDIAIRYRLKSLASLSIVFR